MKTKTKVNKKADPTIKAKVGKVVIAHDATRDYTSEQNDKPREDRYFTGTIEINDQTLPITIHLIKGGSFDPNHWSPRCEVGHNLGYKKSCGCQECSGNWGTDTPPTSGLTAELVAKKVQPILEAQGYKWAKNILRQAGGWSFELQCPAGDEREVPAKRFYIAWATPIDCPVHGKHEQIYSEANI